MSGGFGVNIGGCAPWIVLTVMAVGLVIALVVGVVLGAVDVPIRTQASTTIDVALFGTHG